MSCAPRGPQEVTSGVPVAGPVCAREAVANTTRTESPGGETEAAAMATVMRRDHGPVWTLPSDLACPHVNNKGPVSGRGRGFVCRGTPYD